MTTREMQALENRKLAGRIAKAADEGCPFCRSRFHEPEVGSAVFFLSGSGTGTVGVVVPPLDHARPGEFHVSRSHAPSSLWTCHIDRDTFVPIERFQIPSWMPSLSMEDSFYFHESLMACALLRENSDRAAISEGVIGAVTCCWSRRLPVDDMEVWRMLSAHSVPQEFEDSIRYAFAFGSDLAVKLNGRAPSKRRRIPPMSRIQYMTPQKEALWARIKGHNNMPQLDCTT